jgi:RHS repeat-associated protein
MDSYINLYWYGSRWYDDTLGRFIQPDSIIPENTIIPENIQGVQAWDRFAYCNNNPVRWNDPSGHWIESLLDIASIAYDIYDISQNGLNWGTGLVLAADVGGLILPGVTGGGLAVRALTHADEAVDAVRAVNTAGNLAQAANQADNAVDATRAVSVTPVDLYAFGNTTGPRPPRPGKDIFPNSFGNIGPEAPPLPLGASTFGDPNMAPLSGPYHRLPAGTELPSGMSVVADGVDIIPSSTNPPTHYTMYPTVSMPYGDFSKAFTSLPWSYVGKK